MSKHTWNAERARHWNLFMPPARPSAGEVEIYSDHTRGISPAQNWILLGSTPEIRTLAAKRHAQLLCIDRDPEVFSALSSLVDGHPDESLLCCDWLDAEGEPADMVFGDGSMNMLPPQLHEDFCSRLQQLVKPGGKVLLRVHLKGQARFNTPEEVFSWYRNNNRSEPVFSSTRTDLDMIWMEPESGLIDFVNYHQKLEDLYRENGILEEEYFAYSKLMQHNKIKLYYCSVEKFEGLVTRHFDIIARYSGGDYTGHHLHPIFHLQRRD